MIEWQPIETAPRDGTYVLVRTYIGDCWPATFRSAWNDFAKGWVSSMGVIDRQPTHWMPLPEPPHD